MAKRTVPDGLTPWNWSLSIFRYMVLDKSVGSPINVFSG